MLTAGPQQPPQPRQQATPAPEPQDSFASGSEDDYSDSEDEGTEGYRKGQRCLSLEMQAVFRASWLTLQQQGTACSQCQGLLTHA